MGTGLAPAGRLHNLPAPPTPLIGREHELRTARAQLLDEQVRLLTLSGPGGSGKTRLALAVAEDLLGAFPDGVWLVDLTPLSESAMVLPAIAYALGLQEAGRRSTFDILEEYLRGRRTLLVLDNCEHVLGAAPEIAELLGACRQLKVLAASREPLQLRWEHELPVPPLAVPSLGRLRDAGTLGTIPSVALFVQRAQAVTPSFALTDENAMAVASLCVRLDGLPLALELAAARTKLLPVQAILLRLEHGLSLLSSDARDRPARHQTLGAAVDWSYGLLGEEERALFRQLSIFVGGCTLEAAEAVCDSGATGDGHALTRLRSLVDKSLLQREEVDQAEPRFRILETIREFARDQLQARGEADEMARRHAEYFLALAERAEPELIGPRQDAWLDLLDRERANLRAAQRWAVAQGDAETIARLVAALWHFWWVRADASDAREWTTAMVPLARQASPRPALARALQGAGHLAGALGDYATCRSLLEASLAVARQLADRQPLASVLDSLGRQSFVEERYDESRALLTESVALLREIDDGHGLAQALSHLGFLEYLEHRHDAARATYQEGLELAQQAGDPDAIAEFLDNLGRTFHAEGDLSAAVDAYAEAEAIWRDLGQGQRLAMVLNNLGSVQTLRGELGLARAHLLEALGLARRSGNRRRLAFILQAVAALAAVEAQPERAVRLDAAAWAAVAEMGASLGQPINAAGARHVERARQALGAAAEPTETAGRTLTLAAAVDDALAWLTAPTSTAPDPTSPGGLTRREIEVVALVARGASNRQIAEALVISPHTAERHVERILAKLGCSSRAEIAAWATRHGLADA